MLHQDRTFDYYVIVGGFMYDDLKAAIEEEFKEFGDKILTQSVLVLIFSVFSNLLTGSDSLYPLNVI